jgi:MucR family transcriptional regulator, transcriptional regulator of exopolysaccharide biosynthesis
MTDEFASRNFVELTADIVAAYVRHNPVSASDIPAIIGQVHSALAAISGGRKPAQGEPPKPVVSVKRSITPDYLVCLEDGKRFKSLKRHLRTQYNLSPDQYRDKWGLPRDYPMVAPNYAATRSRLAVQIGLGQKRRRRK